MSEPNNTCELNPEEKLLLKKHMEFYRALETGQRQSATTEQKHFVQVTRGQATAETIHEVAYAKHMRLRAEQRAANPSDPPHDPADGPTAEWFQDWWKFQELGTGNVWLD